VQPERKPTVDATREVSFVRAGSEERSHGSIVRLSLAGLVIQSPCPPPEGCDVELTAELLAGEGPVTLGGRVRWSQPGKFSVRFGPLGVRETGIVLKASGRTSGYC
jgi:hypothetical protein